jgi:predicted nucleic acid-binding protein
MALPFLDTNILLRHFLNDHPDHSPRATAFLRSIEDGKTRVRTSEPVVFETVFTLQRQYHVSKGRIAELVLALLDLPGIELPGKQRFHAVFDCYVRFNISFVDAFHAVLMQQLHLTEIVSFDQDFDRVPGISRLEP